MFLQQTIHEVFSAIAGRSPEAVALLCDGRQQSYAELADRSDRIARDLLARGVTRGARVGLYSYRSLESIAAILGILKAGAAYVPFDPSYPANLLRFVYQDCAPSLMLVDRALLEAEGGAAFWDGPAVDIQAAFEGPGEGALRELPRVDREDPAYVMYTSGSSGHPKGVLVPHRGVVRLVIDNPFARMGSDQVHLQLAPLAFDASTFEIWGALLNGGRLAIVAMPYPSLDDIAATIARDGVTTLWLTAGLFHLMVDHRLDGLMPLQQLIAGGDILSPSHVAKALRALPRCRLINGYGPTENTTFTCCYTIPRDIGDGPIPIGLPIAHTQVYVVDEAQNLVLDGAEGELFAGGEGVALGYLNRPELTRERFVANRFDAAHPGRLYRTGDRVRRRADGIMEFLGRVDRQVKINGKRVELDEIEACLRRSALIGEAAVISVAEAGVRRIHAYVASRDGRRLESGEVRSFLKHELPDYMLPATITVMDTLPLSPMGKVDRSKLTPAAIGVPAAAGVVPVPQNDIEAALLGIWRRVLGTQTVGLGDNFFDLGGTSLQLVEVLATLSPEMKGDLTVVDLFRYPRISALAARLQGHGAAPAATAQGQGALTAGERARRQQAALARVRPGPRRLVR